MKKYLILLLCLSFVDLSASAIPGSLVTRFGVNGSAFLNFDAQVIVSAGIVDSQERILIVGQVTDQGGVVARFLPDGTLDSSFNAVGYTFFYYTDTNDIGTSLALYNTTIYVGGYGSDGGFIASFNDDGSLNQQWGVNGIFLLSNSPLYVFDIIAQPDGKIISCGNLDGTNGYVARTTMAGTALDPAFNAAGTPGYQVLSDFENANSCTLDSNGNIFVAASDNDSTLVYMFTAQGLLNTTFNATGVSPVISDFLVNQLILQSNGSVVVGGSNAAASQAVMIRMTPLGVVDSTFGVNGYVIPAVPTSCLSLMSGINDVLYMGCFDDDANEGNILSYNVNGILNTSFGTNGMVTLADIIYGVVIIMSSKNGNIIAGGYTAPVGPTPNYGLLQEVVEYTQSTLGISGSQFVTTLQEDTYVITPAKVYATPVVLPASANLATRTILSGL